MDLSEPATVVIPPGTAAVIRALAGTDLALTMRQLARIAGVSHQRTGQVIERLAVIAEGPRLGAQQAGDGLQRGRLACAVGTNERDQFTLGH